MKKIRRYLSAFFSCLILMSSCVLSACAAAERSFPAKGVDLSSWQKEVDFSKLKDDGISFVILRAGTTMGKDLNFDKFYREAKHAGLDIGCYFYTYATDESGARKDVQNLLSWIKHRKFQYPIYIDIEDETLLSLSKAERMKICEIMRQTLKQENYLVGIYSNDYWFNHYLDSDLVNEKYEVWLASWSSTGKPDSDMSGKCRLWQYTSSGKTKAVDSRVDMNVCYFDYPSYVTENGLNNYTKKPSVKEALKIGDIWKTNESENTPYYTGPSEKNFKIGEVESGRKICVTSVEEINGKLWGKTAIKGVCGWIKLEKAEKISQANVFVSNNGECRLDEKNKKVYGLDGSKEDMLDNVFANNLYIKFFTSNGSTKLGFVYDGYVQQEFLLS